MEYIRLAGWPAYPIIALGVTCLVLAIRHAAIPQRSLVPLIIGTGVATVLFGALGTILGLQHAIEFIDKVEPGERWIWIKGLYEALHCLDFALCPTVLAAMLTGVGSWRLRSRMDEVAARS